MGIRGTLKGVRSCSESDSGIQFRICCTLPPGMMQSMVTITHNDSCSAEISNMQHSMHRHNLYGFPGHTIKFARRQDHVPELLAVIRRKPFAEPTETEMVEYLFTRVRSDRRKPDFENFAFEHVLSYQRRIAATKEHFMRRNKVTPLGIIHDWWEVRRDKRFVFHQCLCLWACRVSAHHQDRTEAQMRAALHDL